MRLALVIDMLDDGGAERVVRELATGLAGNGHDVGVYCLKAAGPYAPELADRGVRVRCPPHDYSAGLPAWGLLQVWRRDRVDLVHAHSSAALVQSWPAARCLDRPLLHTRHGNLLGRPSRYRRLADLLAPRTDRTIIVAESLRRQLKPAELGRHAVHIPNGIDRPAISPKSARTQIESLCGRPLPGPVLLSVGTLSPEKDTVGLLAAFARLRARRPDATLVAVGAARTPQYAEQVAAECRRLNLGDSVVLPGSQAEPWRLMSGADVFCLSSRSEAMPLVVVEAMSQGVPIVATAVGDVGRLPEDGLSADHEMLRHRQTALLVPPADPAALADALEAVFSDREASTARAARAADEYARRFTTREMVARYESLYAECLAGRSRRGRHKCVQPGAPRPRVLHVGPGADQIGGMAGVISLLLASPLNEQFDLSRFSPRRAAVAEMRTARNSTEPDRSRWNVLARRLLAVPRHLSELLSLARVIRRRRVDLVHLHTCSFLTFYRTLADLAVARLLGRRACLHLHGGRFTDFCRDAGPLGRWLIRRGARAADAVFVLSEQWARSLRPYFGRTPLTVVPNGVPVAPLDEGRPRRDGPCRFLFLGALTRRKGVAELLAAVERLRDTGVPFELTLAGPAVAHDAEDWPAVIRSRDLARHVRVLPPVFGAAKDELLRAADCLVLPSHAEALPLVILEAAAAGKAVIATSVGSLPELMQPERDEKGAREPAILAPLVPPRDIDALAGAMRRLAENPELRREISRSLHRRVATSYSLSLVADRLAATYRRMLSPPPTREWRAESWLVRTTTYRLHEWLQGRPTLRVLREMVCLLPRPQAEVGRVRDNLRWPRGADATSARGGDATKAAEPVEGEANQRLRDLLVFAADRLPFYQRLFADHGVDPAASEPAAELHKLPALEKATVRAAAAEMTWNGVPGGLIASSSGGTSGDTLHFHVDRRRQAQDLAGRLFMQSLFGVQPGDRRLHFWGSPIEARRAGLKRWRDRAINELLLNAFDLGPANLDAHLARLRSFRPRVLYGYPTALALLARHAGRTLKPADFRWLKLVVLTGEEVTPEQSRQVRETFGCPVASEYGSREVGVIAHDCPHGRMHVLTPHVWVEIAAGGRPLPAATAGDVLCTTLGTRAQPLIRYRVGDAARWDPQSCPCGLPLPVLHLEGGKITGFVALPDGRLCHGAITSHVLREEQGIVAFKTIQHTLTDFELLLVVDRDFEPGACERIRQRYRLLFGPRVNLDCRLVEQIPPDPSGKRRYVVSKVAPNCREYEIVAAP